MEQINVEDIMQTIREEIETSGVKNQKLSFDDKWDLSTSFVDDNNTLKQLLSEMSQHMTLNYYRELEGNRFKVFIKRVIRKCCAFLIIPMINEQNVFNQKLYELCEEIVRRMNAQ